MRPRIKQYEVYREHCRDDVVAVITAWSYYGALKQAREMGYGEGFEVEEVERYE
jgi:hypothetical protein